MWITAAVMFALTYVTVFLLTLSAVKTGKGMLMKFCGADFYTFDVKRRMKRVAKIALIAACVMGGFTVAGFLFS